MSAYGTQKPGGQRAVQLTFPAVRTQIATPHAYLPSDGVEAKKPFAGDDFQALWHEQKRADAHRMCRAKVIATAHHRSRAMSSHMGYFGMPKAVLGQRQYANPSGGALVISSTRQDGNGSAPTPFLTTEDMRQIKLREPDTPMPLRMRNDFDGLRGGVLRTAEGQGHAQGRMKARLDELNRIDVEKMAFSGDMDGALQKAQLSENMSAEKSGLENPSEGVGAKIELNNNLQSILDALLGSRDSYDVRDYDDEQGSMNANAPGDKHYFLSRLKVDDVTKTLKLAFRLTPMSSAPEIVDWQNLTGDIVEELTALTTPDRRDVEEVGLDYARLLEPKLQTYTTCLSLFQKLHRYFAEMVQIGTGAKSRGTLNERIAKSRSLVQHLGFAKSTREMDPREHHQLVRQAERGGLEPSMDDSSSESGGDDDDSDEDDSDSSGGDEDAREQQNELDLGSNAHFSRRANRREDDEHDEANGRPPRGRGRVRVMPNNGADQNREEFGEGAGEEEQDVGVASGGRGRDQPFFNEPAETARERDEEQDEEEADLDDEEFSQPRGSHAVASADSGRLAPAPNVSRIFSKDTGGWDVAPRKAEDGGAGQPPIRGVGRPKKSAPITEEAKQSFLSLNKKRDVEGMLRWCSEQKCALPAKVVARPTRTTVFNAVNRITTLQ